MLASLPKQSDRRALIAIRLGCSICWCIALHVVFCSANLKAADPPLKLRQLARFDDSIQESSGVAQHGDSFWTHNDSGNDPVLFELNRHGQQRRSVRITNAENVDWEAMAHDREFLYVGDIGNNLNARDELCIYRVAWDSFSRNTAEADLITFAYGDRRPGKPFAHNFDAEALAVRGEELWLFTKNRGDRRTNLYRFPKVPGHYVPKSSQSLPVDSLVTGADIHPETGNLVLVSNRRTSEAIEKILWCAPTTDGGVDWSRVKSSSIVPVDQWEAVLWQRDAARLILTHEQNERAYGGVAAVSAEAAQTLLPK